MAGIVVGRGCRGVAGGAGPVGPVEAGPYLPAGGYSLAGAEGAGPVGPVGAGPYPAGRAVEGYSLVGEVLLVVEAVHPVDATLGVSVDYLSWTERDVTKDKVVLFVHCLLRQFWKDLVIVSPNH